MDAEVRLAQQAHADGVAGEPRPKRPGLRAVRDGAEGGGAGEGRACAEQDDVFARWLEPISFTVSDVTRVRRQVRELSPIDLFTCRSSSSELMAGDIHARGCC